MIEITQEMLTACCKQLRLSEGMAQRAMIQEGGSHQEYLYKLLDHEIKRRKEARILKLKNTAGFPRRYTPEQYKTSEITFPKGVTFESLLDLNFYHEGNNILMYGGTGTGKTMLSILIGLSACEKEIPVKFYRTGALVNLFSENKENGKLSLFKKKLNKAEILILDEFGYVPYDRIGAQLLFDYISEIEEEKSVILSTNLEFSQWVNVLYDEQMTAALIGRLTHHVELILFPGGNNRIRESSISEAFAKRNNQ